MNDQTVYWVWIQQIIGYASDKINPILNKFTFAEDFYRASVEEKYLCGCFSAAYMNKFLNPSLDKAWDIVRRCNSCGADIVSIGDIAYPKRLKSLAEPPVVLYVKGNREVLSDEFSIAMVGTRTATVYGQRCAMNFSYELAKNNATIVSGGALGIDTVSHKGTLRADGKTVCVLGCGSEYKYLSENDEMKRQILRRGAVISEYPPDTRASKGTFPQRNRIISGLSKGVIVIEAGMGSGSLITARCAREQNREVFAFRGDVHDRSSGTEWLIRNGSIAVRSPYDVLKYYGKTAAPKKGHGGFPFDELSPEELDRLFADRSAAPKRNNRKANGAKAAETEKIKKENRSADNKAVKNKAEPEKKGGLPKIPAGEYNNLLENDLKILLTFKNEVMHIDKIIEESKLPIYAVQSTLLRLEMLDYIELQEGRNYKILVSVK